MPMRWILGVCFSKHFICECCFVDGCFCSYLNLHSIQMLKNKADNEQKTESNRTWKSSAGNVSMHFILFHFEYLHRGHVLHYRIFNKMTAATYATVRFSGNKNKIICTKFTFYELIHSLGMLSKIRWKSLSERPFYAVVFVANDLFFELHASQHSTHYSFNLCASQTLKLKRTRLCNEQNYQMVFAIVVKHYVLCVCWFSWWNISN